MAIIRVEKRDSKAKTPKKAKKTKEFKREQISNKKFLLIIIIIGLLLIICTSIYRWQNNKKYQGYWCSYVEHSLIVVQLKDGHTDEDDKKLVEKIETFDNVISNSYQPKEGYEEELSNDPDINDAYVVSFSSLDNIGTYIEELEKMPSVVQVTQQNAKVNMALYNLESSSKYTFKDSDEAEEKDIEKGKYKIKNGVITFTPDKKDAETKLLYIKDDHLCEDPDCTRIFASSNETCGTD